jgi:hypothetical protein
MTRVFPVSHGFCTTSTTVDNEARRSRELEDLGMAQGTRPEPASAMHASCLDRGLDLVVARPCRAQSLAAPIKAARGSRRLPAQTLQGAPRET